MTQDVFNARIKRIHRNGPSGATIPGQVGEPTWQQKRQTKPVARRGSVVQVMVSVLLGGILGAFAGLGFQELVGVETLLRFDWERELSLVQDDALRMMVWATVVIGAIALIVSVPAPKRYRKLAGGSLAYMGTAIGVNAQDILALIPPG